MEHTTFRDCTFCKNCESICPENSPIAEIMALFNELEQNNNFDEVKQRFNSELRKITGCVNCGRCLPTCPVKINIPYYILSAKEDFE